MISSVAYLSMHTSPLAQPGTGYAGGMNVYIHELSQTMADQNVEVAVFTRRTHDDQPEVIHHRPGYRVVHVDAGPRRELRVESLPHHVAEFADGVIRWMRDDPMPWKVIHSHYWLSGWSGVLVKEAMGARLINSFHTLGRVMDRTRRPDEPPVPPIRTLTEDEVLARSDAVVAATPHEVDDLRNHYGADGTRIHISPPGVDHIVFGPGDRSAARRWLGLGSEPLLLFAGRIQAHKGIDIAIRALAKLPERLVVGSGRPHLLIVGGPSGRRGEAELRFLNQLVGEHGLDERVHFVSAQPHTSLANFYRAADVLVMPSRSESFGLVAAEAQACGLPVVAADIGGLRYVIDDGNSGSLVRDLEPADFAEAVAAILDDEPTRARLAVGAVANAEKFSWRSTARRLLELYDEPPRG